jgi:hypothetical protein
VLWQEEDEWVVGLALKWCVRNGQELMGSVTNLNSGGSDAFFDKVIGYTDGVQCLDVTKDSMNSMNSMEQRPTPLPTSSEPACITAAFPPTSGSGAASTIVTWMFAVANAMAQTKPTGPAPTIRTWVGFPILAVSGRPGDLFMYRRRL